MDVVKDFTVTKINNKIAHYRQQKRLQGFLQFKCKNKFRKLQSTVRKMKLGVALSPADRKHLQVSIRKGFPFSQAFQFVTNF